MAKKKPPCIRGLQAYKKGCPEKCWDGDEGCKCWIELTIADEKNPLTSRTVKQCIDIWSYTFQLETLRLLEGNQQATESFRNGMVYTDDQGKDVPKPDPVMLKFIDFCYETMESIKKNSMNQLGASDSNILIEKKRG